MVLCFHRLVIRRGLQVCRHCGVQVETCPCIKWRDPDPNCDLCLGSGWIATVRSGVQRFRDYAGISR
jgi:hypothetical protein